MGFLPVEEQMAIIRRGTVEILPEAELIEKLRYSYEHQSPLRIKLGCDPTRPDLHLGHSVILRKMRQFQDLGHHCILIIGDFTGMIGDPTGANKTRPSLTIEAVRENGTSYFEQASKILDAGKTEIVYNSDWLGKMSFEDVIRLASRFTVARMIERDDFTKRFENEEPISLHEFLYPLAQGQDSVFLRSDVELGGIDQKFNLLVGRQLQREHQMNTQVCVMLPLLVGTDGTQKMSKSYDNYIGLDETANDMYGKTLKIPDDLIYTWFELLTDISSEELEVQKKRMLEDPRNAKHDLALEITRLYHGPEAAAAARNHFEQTIVRKEVPDDIPVVRVEAGSAETLPSLIVKAGGASSNSEARRLIQQGGVSVDGEKIADPNHSITFTAGASFILKVGKLKHYRVES